jgi:hypothetical protein
MCTVDCLGSWLEQSSRLLVAELDDDYSEEVSISGDPDSLADFENRVAAPRPETGDQPGGVDAVKPSRNAGADRLPMKKPKKDPVREDRIYNVSFSSRTLAETSLCIK